MRLPLTVISFELKASLSLLLSRQQENGSWDGDPVTTSYCLEALSMANKVISDKSIEQYTSRAQRFLYDWIINTSERLQGQEDIYTDLPSLMSQVGICLSRIWIFEPIKEQALRTAIEKSLENIANSCIRYLHSLSSPSAVANFLLASIAFPSLLKKEGARQQLLDYVLNEMISPSAISRDRSLILMVATYLMLVSRETKELLQLSWIRVRQHSGLNSLPEHIDELLRLKASEIAERVKSEKDVESALMCFRALVMLDPDDTLDIQKSLYEEVAMNVTYPLAMEGVKLCNELIPKNLILALTVLAIGTSKFAKSISFSWKDGDYVRKALSAYDEWNSQRLFLLTRPFYLAWLVLSVSMIGFWLIPIFMPGLLNETLYTNAALIVSLVNAVYVLFIKGIRRPK